LKTSQSNQSISNRSEINKKSSKKVPEEGVWMCLKCFALGCGRYSVKKHALAHYEDNKSHQIAFNTKTMNLWWYRCDFDLIEEGFKANEEDSNTDSSKGNPYREHVEKLYDYLAEVVGEKYKILYNSDTNGGKSTLGSTGFKSQYSGPVSSKSKLCFHI
jgi:hypothetical protein